MKLIDNAFYHLTGETPRQDGWGVKYYSFEDYLRVATEEGDPAIAVHSWGWCCRETPEGLELPVRATLELDRAFGVTAHEIGHSLVNIKNPAQWENREAEEARAFAEAQAMLLEVAFVRAVGEQTGIITYTWPSSSPAGEGGWLWHEWLDKWVVWLKDSVKENGDPYDRGKLIIWGAVLLDPEFEALRWELEENGILSSHSLYKIYTKFSELSYEEVQPYINAITPSDLQPILEPMRRLHYQRVNRDTEASQLTLRNYDLVLLP